MNITEKSFEEAARKIQYSINLEIVIKRLEDNNIIDLPLTENKEEASFHIELLEKYKEHNQEKNHDREGREFYKRIDDYLAKLKNITGQ